MVVCFINTYVADACSSLKQFAEEKLPRYSRSFTNEDYKLMYNNWIRFIQLTVPADRLCVFNVKDGIEPLATFCNRDIPDWIMPNKNDSGNRVKHK